MGVFETCRIRPTPVEIGPKLVDSWRKWSFWVEVACPSDQMRSGCGRIEAISGVVGPAMFDKSALLGDVSNEHVHRSNSVSEKGPSLVKLSPTYAAEKARSQVGRNCPQCGRRRPNFGSERPEFLSS